MEATQHDSRYSWIRLGLSLLLSIVGSAGMWATVVVLPMMQDDLGLERADATLPYLLTMAGFALGNLVLGRVVDRFGITPVAAVAGLASAFGFGVASVAEQFAIIVGVHFFLGLGAGAFFGPLIADVSQWFMARRGIAVAITASGNYLSGAAWPPILIWASGETDWRAAYWVIAVTCFVILIPGALLLRRQIDAVSTARADATAASRRAATGLSPRALQALLAVAGFACCMAMAMPQVHIVALCIDRGFSATAGGQMLSLMLIGGVISRLISGALADRLGGLPVLLIGSVLQCAALCLFLIEGGLTSLYVISAAFGLSQGGIVPSYAIIVREYMPPREAGRRVGIVMFSTIVGMAVGGWSSGWLFDVNGSYSLALWHGIAWNLVNTTIVLMILFRVGRAPAHAV